MISAKSIKPKKNFARKRGVGIYQQNILYNTIGFSSKISRLKLVKSVFICLISSCPNSINLLEENIKHRSQQEKEILSRRKSREIQFFYLFSILNLIIALGSIVISIILLLK